MKPRIAVFSGSGISAESGIPTYRSEDGLWANYKIEDVCTHEAMYYNRHQVIQFYNERRREAMTKQPNAAHLAVSRLAEHFHVDVITQNIDDLHERAGSTDVVHLHGSLFELRSMDSYEPIISIREDQDEFATAQNGELLRPNIVFFGEGVPKLSEAIEKIQLCDILIVVGTSLAVSPANSLVTCVKNNSVPIYVVDPGNPKINFISNPIHYIKQKASIGMTQLVEELIQQF
ncbi:MAG: NAD-dependent deacylase [Alistipes sp.]|nr:NAD-dependent deacylase [Candidatus Alistipes equi]